MTLPLTIVARRRHFFALAAAAILSWSGCKTIPKPPTPPPPPVQVDPTLSNLLGIWTVTTRNQGTSEMIFEPTGGLVFRGGFEFFNPARWTLDKSQRELQLSFPNAPDEKLDLFHMYLKDGVKSFNRKEKTVSYVFDAETSSLNIVGWIYSKPEAAPAPLEAEPVLK